MNLALFYSFGFGKLTDDDLELKALLNLYGLVNDFDDLPYKVLPDDFDFLSYSSSVSFQLISDEHKLLSQHLIFISGFQIFQCSLLLFFSPRIKNISYLHRLAFNLLSLFFVASSYSNERFTDESVWLIIVSANALSLW